MNYGDLSRIKTSGFATNHVIDDAVLNQRFEFKRTWFVKAVTDHDLRLISEFATIEGASFPPAGHFEEVLNRLDPFVYRCDIDRCGCDSEWISYTPAFMQTYNQPTDRVIEYVDNSWLNPRPAEGQVPIAPGLYARTRGAL